LRADAKRRSMDAVQGHRRHLALHTGYQPDRVKLRDGQAAHPRDIRAALALECHRRIDADKTVATLEGLVAERGTAPAFIRCDNGPELRGCPVARRTL
jgi:hypothetical protein